MDFSRTCGGWFLRAGRRKRDAGDRTLFLQPAVYAKAMIILIVSIVLAVLMTSQAARERERERERERDRERERW